MYTKEIRKLRLQNRIALLQSRVKKDNSSVIRKLERELRNLQANETDSKL